MNENERNMQNGFNNQPISSNLEVSSIQPVSNHTETSTVMPNAEVISQPMNNVSMGTGSNSVPENINAIPVDTMNTSAKIPISTTNNFMEDFSQAVVPETVMPATNIPPITPEMVVTTPVAESVSENAPIQEQYPAVENSIPVEASMIHESQQQVAPESISGTEIGVEKKGKKRGNWTFIIVLFAIVSCFVLLLPLLVRIFGY